MVGLPAVLVLPPTYPLAPGLRAPYKVPLMPPSTRARKSNARIEQRGDERLSGLLADALRLPEEEQDLLVDGPHGIHPYPARFHPSLLRRVLTQLPPGALVGDPFCGSGTVLVEAMRSGRPCFGSDINPLAVELARLRTSRWDRRQAVGFVAAATRAHEEAAERRETRFGVLARGERRFPRHVLAQLISLRATIEDEPIEELRPPMLMALSSLMARFASRPGREAPNVNRRAVRDYFLRRCEQIAEALTTFNQEVLQRLPDARIRLADARRCGWPPRSADAIITALPSPGIYDYGEEQALRSTWLELTPGPGPEAEIGRRGTTEREWADGMHQALLELVRITAPGAWIVLHVADGAGRPGPARADQLLRRLLHGRNVHLRRRAIASLEPPPSPRTLGGQPRRRHLILLERP